MLSAYLEDRIDADERLDFREHLGACAACRQIALAEEPTLVFVLHPPREPRAERVEACIAAVTGRIRHERIERRLRGRRGGWLAAAAALVVAATMGVMWRTAPRPADPILSPPEVVATSSDEEVSPPPRVEVDMPGEGVRVYQFAQEDDTAVYFIVNPAMES